MRIKTFITETTIADGFERLGGVVHEIEETTVAALMARGKARRPTPAELSGPVAPTPRAAPGSAPLPLKERAAKPASPRK